MQLCVYACFFFTQMIGYHKHFSGSSFKKINNMDCTLILSRTFKVAQFFIRLPGIQ